MADPVEDLQAAAGDGLVGVLAVADGDDRVARPPDDEDGDALGEVEPVAGVDALAAYADDRAQRGEEGGPAAGVGERRVAASDLGDVRGGPQPDSLQAACERGSRRAPRRGSGGDEQIRARERRSAQDRADLRAQAAAGDQHQALGDLGELVGELHCDPAAERMPYERRAFVAEHDEQVAQTSGERPERVIASTGRRGAVTRKIGRDDGVAPRQRPDHLLPVPDVARHPMDQEQHGAAARLDAVHRPAMEQHAPGLHHVHAGVLSVIRASASASCTHASRTCSGSRSKVSATPDADSRTPTPMRARCIEPSTCA